MRNLTKMITIALMTAVLICLVITCASADDKIYTSPVFKLPKDRLTEWKETNPEDEPEAVSEENEPGEETEPGEATESDAETEPDEQPELQGETETLVGDTVQKKREVRIYSSQGEVVTAYEQIKLSSELIGFEGLTVSYQWQVDRGDGLGWVDVEGATRENHVFRATRETIQYSWRLIVNIIDEE